RAGHTKPVRTGAGGIPGAFVPRDTASELPVLPDAGARRGVFQPGAAGAGAGGGVGRGFRFGDRGDPGWARFPSMAAPSPFVGFAPARVAPKKRTPSTACRGVSLGRR